MTVHMSRAEWQAAQYRHTMADGSPAVVRWAAGVGTVLEPVKFTDVCEEDRDTLLAERDRYRQALEEISVRGPSYQSWNIARAALDGDV